MNSINASTRGRERIARINGTSSASPCTADSKARFALNALSVCVMLAFASGAHALPAGGVVAAGGATISSGANSMTINQSTQNAIINWQSFNVSQGNSVRFVQPNTSSVALNRVVGSNPSGILGNLSSNGKVFLVNPNGILFGQGSSVNVGGLVASTLGITDNNFMTANYAFTGAGAGAVVNQGSISANGAYVALLGANISNRGVIAANLGTVVLAAGNAVTLDVAGDGLLNIVVNQGAVNALIENGGLIRAHGGQVILTASAAGSLLNTVVNNTGVIEAQTLVNRGGTIKLLADMQSGTVNAGGSLDASAPAGGDGGFIETSAARIMVQPGVQITTAAPSGKTGTWLIDPEDFNIGGLVTDNISGATLSALLVTNSVVITTLPGTDAMVAGTPPVTNLFTNTVGNGDINVNQAITWTGSSSATTLTLLAVRNANVNAAISATNGNLQICTGNDININAALTTVNGSILMGAGGNVNLNAAISTTDGNISIGANRNIFANQAMTLTRGSVIPGQSLGLPLGLVLNAGSGGTGPGVAAGTLVYSALAPDTVVTGPNAPITINYNPVSYATPTNYSGNFVVSLGAAVTQRMLVFPDNGSKTFDGTTATSLSLLKGSPAGVTLIAGPGNTANFIDALVGTNKSILYSGYSLGGADANNFALAIPCCEPGFALTTGDVSAPVLAPVIVAPAVVAPAAVSPIATSPTTIVEAFSPSFIPLTFVSAAPPMIRLVEEAPIVQAPIVAPPPPVPVPPPPPAPPPPPPTIVVPAPPPPPPFVAPPLPPKQDRN